MGVLGSKPESSVRVVSALNHRAIYVPLYLNTLLFVHVIFYMLDDADNTGLKCIAFSKELVSFLFYY